MRAHSRAASANVQIVREGWTRPRQETSWGCDGAGGAVSAWMRERSVVMTGGGAAGCRKRPCRSWFSTPCSEGCCEISRNQEMVGNERNMQMLKEERMTKEMRGKGGGRI